MIPGEKITMDNLNHLIEHHMAFLIRTVSNFTGRYVSVENDDEFSIALSAFAEAVECYDEKRGQFLGFAKLVIESRLKNYAVQKKRGTDGFFRGTAGGGQGLCQGKNCQRESAFYIGSDDYIYKKISKLTLLD